VPHHALKVLDVTFGLAKRGDGATDDLESLLKLLGI